ncbi:S41 family peptidase [Tuanshanicoccus lijuaniae]|uniref:S41 family peptidase n=1 Tax=Aerococcaceae bacterium zg-1292 TaxID=2774330 RepID=UPI001935CF51|nr:S41 family peptidase [Aerococcaceae bacterium zg-1292]MBF6625585.1 S41 family peptidase [Aerococcaceae bacterium zg-BR9]MBF6977768.1 S41 family peptidase [Aerococcaceae bacterium zg-BR22]QQA36357.1 S41 family peptidase [Aerococcaceae bacterium zg-1292]
MKDMKRIFGTLLCSAMILSYAPSMFAQETTTETTTEQTTQQNTKPVKESPLNKEDIQKIIDVYNSILDKYIEDVDKNTLLQGALEGMVSSLGDPYSEYLDAEKANMFDESIEGSFSGIGVQFTLQNGQVVIISAIAGTPAERAGLQPNDIILEADGEKLLDKNTSEIVKLIRGEVGSKVTLKIQRGSTTFDVTVERAEIPVVSVTGEIDKKNKAIGHIKISQFSATTAKELEEAVTKLRKEGAKAFVIDLRNNPGGLLDQAIKMGNMFLKQGQNILQMQEPHADPVPIPANDVLYGKFKIKEPYAVLINGGSASASEILAAAIGENTDYPLVGKKTFGKGTAQNITSKSELGELKLTVAKWLTPKGTWIHKTGVNPDVEVAPEPLSEAILLNYKEKLQEGDSNDYVKSAIVMLRAFGYEIESDYIFDASVKKAVEKFQAEHDLNVDGIITGDTATALNTAAREYLQTHDSQYDKAVESVKKLLGQNE